MAIANFTVIEGRKFNIPFTMSYSADWHDPAKQGLPIEQADVDTVYFYMKRRANDAVARLELTDADAAEIDWIDTENGEIEVLLGANTSGFAGYNDYELSIKWPDGSFSSVEIGKMFVQESVVDNPV
jgi:hypothetical protein